MSKQRQVAERFHPGELLREEIKERRLGRVQFVSLCMDIGLNDLHIIEVLREERPINEVLAFGISKVLGIDTQIWLNLQKVYDDWEPEGGE